MDPSILESEVTVSFYCFMSSLERRHPSVIEPPLPSAAPPTHSLVFYVLCVTRANRCSLLSRKQTAGAATKRQSVVVVHVMRDVLKTASLQIKLRVQSKPAPCPYQTATREENQTTSNKQQAEAVFGQLRLASQKQQGRSRVNKSHPNPKVYFN